MANCKKCKAEKQQDDFYFNKRANNFDSTCKDCRRAASNAYMKKRMTNDPEFRDRQLQTISKLSLKSNRTGAAKLKKLNNVNDKYYNGEKVTQDDIDYLVANTTNCFSCGMTEQEYVDFRDRVLSYVGDNKTAQNFSAVVFKTSNHKAVSEFVFAQLDINKPNVKDNLVRVCYPCKMIVGSGFGIEIKKEFAKKMIDHVDGLV